MNQYDAIQMSVLGQLLRVSTGNCPLYNRRAVLWLVDNRDSGLQDRFLHF
jgi:hypothetical protein